MKDFKKGLKAGIPVGLGYLSVSFAFGIMAVSLGFKWWQAVLISMTNLTSAGQLAGIEIMINPAQYIDMLLSQITINIRYSFMSVSLSQKVTTQFSGIKRWILGFFMTDEIFAVAANEKEVSVKFFSGLTVFPYLGWAMGTLLGSVLGNVLSAVIMNALCLAIYGMFVAIVAPKAKESLSLLLVVGIAIALSCAFYYLPFLSTVSSGLAICICAIAAAIFGAIAFPVKEENTNG
ncbi:MAG: AzlC family ABC transporter permease [Ruminococcus sp.]|nr:AzlC family ABC transporter permease [Ruminococcus sp.]